MLRIRGKRGLISGERGLMREEGRRGDEGRRDEGRGEKEGRRSVQMNCRGTSRPCCCWYPYLVPQSDFQSAN